MPPSAPPRVWPSPASAASAGRAGSDLGIRKPASRSLRWHSSIPGPDAATNYSHAPLQQLKTAPASPASPRRRSPPVALRRPHRLASSSRTSTGISQRSRGWVIVDRTRTYRAFPVRPHTMANAIAITNDAMKPQAATMAKAGS